MTKTESINKFLTEKVMGECWHESSGMTWICGNCKSDIGWRGNTKDSVAVETLNWLHNDFTKDWNAFGKLWEFCVKQEWWNEFLGKLPTWVYNFSYCDPVCGLINPQTFAEAVAKFHGWEEVKE